MTWWEQQARDLGVDLYRSTHWSPTYEPPQIVTTVLGNGSLINAPVSEEYLATASTAEYLRAKYNPIGKVVSEPFLGPGGPSTNYPPVRFLEWPNGIRIIAGMLAAPYSHMPNDPDTADRMCRDIILARGAK